MDKTIAPVDQAPDAQDGLTDEDLLADALVAAEDLIIANGGTVVWGSVGSTDTAGRVLKDRAEPSEVRAYFAGTGLAQKVIAEILGVSTSLISTVQTHQPDNGKNRWSTDRFAEARDTIDQWIADRDARNARMEAARARRIAQA